MSPERATSTASGTVMGMPRLTDSRLPVPAGRTAMGTSVPTRAAIASITVPSPPETARRSTPSAMAFFASACAPSSLLVAMNWQV